MDQSGATQTSFSNSPLPLQPIGVAGCLRYGLLVGLVFGVASGATLAVRRIPDFPDDILERCFARGIFGGVRTALNAGLLLPTTVAAD